jgi:hypothetical protein
MRFAASEAGKGYDDAVETFIRARRNVSSKQADSTERVCSVLTLVATTWKAA